MSILIDENTEVIIQGITGSSGNRLSKIMYDYGTKLVGGVTPGKGGQRVLGLPVFNTVEEAQETYPKINATLICVPAALAKEAAFEAIYSGIKVIVLRTERIPNQDMIEIITVARKLGSIVIGANSIGVVSPGKCLIGSLGGTAEFAKQIFKPGPCGVISRSGGQTTTVCTYLTSQGIGQSTVVGIGGDAIVGSTTAEIIEKFENDEQTKAVCVYGEVGSVMEEEVANQIKKGNFRKPVVMYIAGKYTKKEMRFGHAGAILSGNEPTVDEKIKYLRDCGVKVADHLGEIAFLVKDVLQQSR